MPIDNCTHTFADLSTTVLPAHLERLKAALQSPLPASTFVGFKSASREVLSRLGRTTDFPGCYVFIDLDHPVYVGISRGVVKRLAQHLNFESHFTASLVYKMATDDFPHEMKRDQAMKDDQFREVFLTAQGRLREMSVAFVQIDNDLELYLFEVMAAMHLDTDTWNTFRTH
ncbi:GIY-YIG nuclease family protein [Burkholderia sp. S171]|uniref:GIY-YIG nuclease family protein n=1 Tax=Burkholderia sp. S171 TaxID=1641860 RepID=UPI001C202CE4|nr:GIY-YIG nuclease family protein [Burkholderia sp. S171]